VWWVLSVGLWLLTVAPVSLPEIPTAAVAALPCAALAVAARRAAGSTWRPRAEWLRWLPVLPVSVLADTARVLTGRREPGGVRRIGLSDEPDAATGRTRRAVVTLLLSLTPGSYVQDAWDDRVVLHTRGGGRPRMDEVVRR
jgi:hypothetical protein